MIGAVIIKHKLNLSDEETVLQIQENPYLQYFVGLSSYKDEPPFTASLFVEIRKRMGQQARKRYLAISKKRNPGGKLRRKAIREQLQYLRRNFRHIEMLLDMIGDTAFSLHHKRQRQYWIIQHLYGQQYRMYKDKKRRCDDRIVSISQPHVRPIVRGKASHKVEFGSKLSVSMVDGIALVDHFGWDAFNESTDMITQIESYKKRYGCFPEVVLADGIYGTRANRKYMKKHNIRFGGKPLGRPKKQTAENAEQLKQEKLQRRQDALDRIPIEGKFGQGKNGYRLNYIRARTLKTSEAWINSIFLVMNLMVLLRFCYVLFTGAFKKVQLDIFANLLTEMLSVFVFQVMRKRVNLLASK